MFCKFVTYSTILLSFWRNSGFVEYIMYVCIHILYACVYMYVRWLASLATQVATLKCDGTRAETRFRLSAKGTSPLNRRGRQFSRLLAAEVCASVVVMLDTPCSEVVWRVLATHSIRQFPFHFPSCASPCAITFQLESTLYTIWLRFDKLSAYWVFIHKCFIWFSVQTAVVFLCCNWFGFYSGEVVFTAWYELSLIHVKFLSRRFLHVIFYSGEVVCLLRGTDWV